ncbi:RcgA family putative transporter [Rhizobium laguerreae]|uniref:RcgA family putative transporter n=1 Tax=Rhizobium laguerreae TaxID=1076926 RepID=UPI003CCE6271
MPKNGKLFLPPPKDGSDFKELFKQSAAAGAGRPLGSDGFPAGPWTPELLAEAISHIDSNRTGVDLRTVQLWFQENEKGISTTNIRWLARVFGCDDPVATSEWQMELSAAQSRLTAKRRGLKKAGSSPAAEVPNLARNVVDEEMESPAKLERDTEANQPSRRFNLARRSEALFSRGSTLDLPASVFAGATALGFLSYIVGIHNATYNRADGLVKQVGFLWAPNWTFLFMVFLPLFFAFVIELLLFWKNEGRLRIVAAGNRLESDAAWARNVDASSYTYWAVFIVCVLFAGVFQWIGVCLVPLVKGGGNYAIDWGKLALVRPEVISVPMEIVFTAFAYLYMCLCFYLFFVGLICFIR